MTPNPDPLEVAAAIVRVELASTASLQQNERHYFYVEAQHTDHIQKLERQLEMERMATASMRVRMEAAHQRAYRAECQAARNAEHEEWAWEAFACSVIVLLGVALAGLVWVTR